MTTLWEIRGTPTGYQEAAGTVKSHGIYYGQPMAIWPWPLTKKLPTKEQKSLQGVLWFASKNAGDLMPVLRNFPVKL